VGAVNSERSRCADNTAADAARVVARKYQVNKSRQSNIDATVRSSLMSRGFSLWFWSSGEKVTETGQLQPAKHQQRWRRSDAMATNEHNVPASSQQNLTDSPANQVGLFLIKYWPAA